MSELARVVAFVFQHQGKERLPRNEFKQVLSFRLNWYPPAQASQIVDRALTAGLLREEGDALVPAFDPARVELPVGFRGGARALDELLPTLPPAPRVAPDPAADPALQERVQALRALARGRLSPEAALLLALRERGGDVRAEAARTLAAMAAASAGTPGERSS